MSTTRTNGNGVPRGWHRFSSFGSAYFYGKHKSLVMVKRRPNALWQVWDSERHEHIATGKTMIECHEAVMALLEQEVQQ